MIWRFLSNIGLVGCFALLIGDFVRFFQTGGEVAYFTIKTLLSASARGQIEIWVLQTGTTWGNITRQVIEPIITWIPLWALCLFFVLILRFFAKKPL